MASTKEMQKRAKQRKRQQMTQKQQLGNLELNLGPLNKDDEVYKGMELVDYYDGKDFILLGESVIFTSQPEHLKRRTSKRVFTSTVFIARHSGKLERVELEALVKRGIEVNANKGKDQPVLLIEVNLEDGENPKLSTISNWDFASVELLNWASNNFLQYVGYDSWVPGNFKHNFVSIK